MNYDEARQIAETPDTLGGWHWTTANDGIIRTARPCRQYKGDTSDPLWYMKPTKPQDWEVCEPHPTKEAAERHFYDYSLSQLHAEHIGWTDCDAPGCEQPANIWYHNKGLSLMFSDGVNLCQSHFDNAADEILQQVRPFHTNIQLIHS